MKTTFAQESFLEPIIVDNFAGGGGASTGIELATGRIVNIAINHDPAAILMHKTNHPHTEHLQASVWDVDPVEVCRGRPVGLAWFSPDCKHFSKAKGAALVDRNIRGLAWIELRWAAKVRPALMITENVKEFLTWGPVRKGRPVKSKAGQTFEKWKRQLEALGYVVEWRILVAADYGAPTTRKRLVIIARCDGKPIVWPERTHTPRDSEEVRSGKLKPWRSAAEIIDWTLPCPSIFATKAEIEAQYGLKAVRPLANNTLRRVIRGVDKFTIKSGKPFIVQGKFQNSPQDIEKPLTTVTSVGAHEVVEPMVAPFLADCNHSGGGHIGDVDAPVGTITRKCTTGVVEPLIAPVTFSNTNASVGAPANQPIHTIRTGGGGGQLMSTAQLMQIGQTGGGDRGRDAREPLPTTVSKAEACVTSAQLIHYHTEQTESVRAAGLDGPINTVDASNRYGLVTAGLVEYYGNGRPLDVTEPTHTATSHDREALTTAILQPCHAEGYHGRGNEPDAPVNTVTNSGAQSLVCSHVCKFKGTNLGHAATEPLETVTAYANSYAAVHTKVVRYAAGVDLQHWPEIRALLNQHCGYNLADDEVLLLSIGGHWYYIADIGLRMLSPRELYNAMGFPPDYRIDTDYLGNPYPKMEQVARCGNAVCPPMAAAVVRANLPEWCGEKYETMAAFERAAAV